VPRFAPWVNVAVDATTVAPLVDGPILVPCCGPFPELEPLLARYPGRDVAGIDLSARMVELARARTGENARVFQGDAAVLDPAWTNACAAVVSVFGLQQLPEPNVAIKNWIAALRPGGVLSVVFWPDNIEDDGPFAALDQIEARSLATGDWQNHLAAAVTGAGATIERDDCLAFPMSHPDAETYWTAVTTAGPLRARAIARGEAYMAEMRDKFLQLAPTGPWNHHPRARFIFARRN
jgi:SAM-dependent methyltransferase